MAGLKQLCVRWLIPPALLALGLEGRAALKRLTPKRRALSRMSRELEKRHAGERCFIIGTGPSIARQELKLLAGETVLSVSGFFRHPDLPVIRPRYHVLPPVFANHRSLHSLEKYLAWFADMDRLTLDAELFLHLGDREILDRHGLFAGRTVHWVEYAPWDESATPPLDLMRIPRVWSVSETALTVALYLGFREIYLVGFDHDWFNGAQHHFYPDREEDKKAVEFADAEFQMRRHAYIFKKYKYLYGLRKNVYNANADADSYVDVFPKVRFESLFGASTDRSRHPEPEPPMAADPKPEVQLSRR